MAPDTDSPRNDDRDLALIWSARVSLTPRILFVNIFALALLAGGFFYLDSYRSRIVDARAAQASREARLIAEAMAAVQPEWRNLLALRLARDTGARLRLFDAQGTEIADTRALGLHNFILQDPDKQDWGQDTARFLDAVIDTVVNAPRAPLYRERTDGLAWPDVRTARTTELAPATVWRAPDRTPVFTAAAALSSGGGVVTTGDARDHTHTPPGGRVRPGGGVLVGFIVPLPPSFFLFP